MQPSLTSSVYRVSYHRVGSPPKKGYTSKFFATEQQAQNYIAFLVEPLSEKILKRYPKITPIEEVHLDSALARWQPVDLGDPQRPPARTAPPFVRDPDREPTFEEHRHYDEAWANVLETRQIDDTPNNRRVMENLLPQVMIEAARLVDAEGDA